MCCCAHMRLYVCLSTSCSSKKYWPVPVLASEHPNECTHTHIIPASTLKQKCSSFVGVCLFCERGCHYVAHADRDLSIFLPPLPQCWHCRPLPSHLVCAVLGIEPRGRVHARQALYQKNSISSPTRAVLPILGLADLLGVYPCLTPCCPPLPGISVALPSPVSFPSSLAGGVGAAWLACFWLRPRCRLAHGPIPPHQKLGRQENTRHSCAKVAAGGQAAGGGGQRRGPRATRTFGGSLAGQTLLPEGHVLA